MDFDCSIIPTVDWNSLLTFDYAFNAICVVIASWIWYNYFWKIIDWREDFYETYDGPGGLRSASWRKALLINEARKSRLDDYPHPYPNGWFVLMDSYELKKNVAKEVHMLGLNLVVWRGKSGTVYLSDAYCPHLGAHLGVGGTVHGECIRCPFHAWEYDGSCDGRLAKIPYSSTILKSVKLRMRRVLEQDGVIYMWYHEENEEPSWFPKMPKEFEGMHLRGKFEFKAAIHCQDLFENVMDLNHFKHLHGFSKASLTWAKREGKGNEHLADYTLLSNFELFGYKLPGRAYGEMQGSSLYFGVMESLLGTFVHTVTSQPIDRLVTVATMRIYSTHSFFNPFDVILLLTQYYLIRQDMPIWNRKAYHKSLTLPKEDELIQTGRKWYKQYYSSESNKTPKALRPDKNPANTDTENDTDTDQPNPKQKLVNANGKANGIRNH